MKTRIITSAIFAIALTLTTTACSNTDTTTGATQRATTTETETMVEETTEQATEETTQETETGNDLEAPFGQTITWNTGHEITISEPHPYEITNEYIAEDYPGTIIQFDITYKNGTNEPTNAGSFYITGTSAGTEITPVYDEENDMPSADVMPGDTLTYTAAFEVEDPTDISLKFDLLTFIDDPAYYTNN